MDQKTEARGTFTMNLNFRRKTNERAPAITGRISAPETPDQEHSFSAFEQTDDKGQRYWIGPVEPTTSIRQALHAEAAQGTHFVAVRTNSFKVFKTLENGQTNPAYEALSAEEKAKEDLKPDFWATWTRDTKKDKPLRCAAWEREPNRYGPWASGHTQYPIPREQAERSNGTQMEMLPDVSQTPEPEAPRRRKGMSMSGR